MSAWSPDSEAGCGHLSVDNDTWLDALLKTTKNSVDVESGIACPAPITSIPVRTAPWLIDPDAGKSCGFCGSLLGENKVCPICCTVDGPVSPVPDVISQYARVLRSAY